MSVETNLREMERSREAYWLRYPNTSPMKLRWRAVTVRHGFHVLPGESIVELGAGKVLSGLAKRIDRELETLAVGLPADVEPALKAL